MKYAGFTLIELLITVAVVGILTSIGILSYLPFLNQNRAQSDAIAFSSIARAAVAEARRLNKTTTLSASGNTWSVKQSTTVLRSQTFDKPLTIVCNGTCPASFNFVAPYGRSAIDFKATSTRGQAVRTVYIRGPNGWVTVQ